MGDLPQRKPQRLENYDYAQAGAYFITICTQDRQPLFGTAADGAVVLNHAGRMVGERLAQLAPDLVFVERYCVMPDHIHAILTLAGGGTAQRPFPTVSELVRRYKTLTTKLYIDGVKAGRYPPFRQKIWQKSFYDHIIRNEQDYWEICRYIEENPAKYAERFFSDAT